MIMFYAFARTDQATSLPPLTKYQSVPLAATTAPWAPNMAHRHHTNKPASTNDDSFRVDIEVYGYHPMKFSVPNSNRSAGASAHHARRGNAEGEGYGMHVRRIRLSVHALSPLLRRRRRHWGRASDTTNTSYTSSSNRQHFAFFNDHKKLYFNRVVSLTITSLHRLCTFNSINRAFPAMQISWNIYN